MHSKCRTDTNMQYPTDVSYEDFPWLYENNTWYSYDDDMGIWNDTYPPPPPPPPSTDPRVNYNEPKTISFVCIGIIIPIGFFFNTLSFIVFLTSRTLRNTTTGLYLLALAIADSLFLVGEFIRWISTDLSYLGIYIDFMDRSNVLCIFVFCLRYGAKLASAWLTVVITVERFITVAFPLKVHRLSTTKIAKGTIAVVYLISVISGLFPIWTVGILDQYGFPICGIRTDRQTEYNICSWIFLRAGSLVIPGLLIKVFVALIIANLVQAKRVRLRKLSSNSRGFKRSQSVSNAVEKQLTMMLLAVAIAFVLLRLPYTVAFYLHLYRFDIYGDDISIYTSYKLFYAMKMTDILASTNYAINFFLYCWCGSSFRRQLKFLCRCDKRALQRQRSGEPVLSSQSSRNGSLRRDYGKGVEFRGRTFSNRGDPSVVGLTYNDRRL